MDLEGARLYLRSIELPEPMSENCHHEGRTYVREEDPRQGFPCINKINIQFEVEMEAQMEILLSRIY